LQGNNETSIARAVTQSAYRSGKIMRRILRQIDENEPGSLSDT
jgi:hypothetical protein